MVSKISLMLIGIIILVLPLVMADLSWDNVKNFDKDVGDYGKVYIKDWFGLQDLADIQLVDNTDWCPTGNCWAKLKITMYQKGKLTDSVRFLKDLEVSNINSYEFYTFDGYEYYEVPVYESVCEKKLDENKTLRDFCRNVQVDSKTQSRQKWKEYNYEEVTPGTYTLLLKGNIGLGNKVDWQITSQGILLDDWALWDSDEGAYYYYAFDEGTGTNASDSTGHQDFTVVDKWTTHGILDDAYNNTGSEGFNSTLVFQTMNGTEANITMNFWIYRYGEFDDSYFMATTTNEETGKFLGSANSADSDITFNYWDNDGTDNQKLTRWADDTWTMITLSLTKTNFTIYVNGEGNASETMNNWNWSAEHTLWMFEGVGGASDSKNYYFDEFGIWNRTLNSSELTDLYNGGVALAYGAAGAPSGVTVTLNRPSDSATTYNTSIIFNATIVPSYDLQNATLYIWHDNNTLFYSDTNETITGEMNQTKWNVTGWGDDIYYWNVEGCDDGGAECVMATANYTLTWAPYEVVAETYNGTTYETSTENFILNVTTDGSETVSAKFFYNGTEYTAAKTGVDADAQFTNELDMPIGNVTKNFFWTLNIGGNLYNTTKRTQNLTAANLTLCGDQGGTVNFINLTFKYETNDSATAGYIDTSTWTYWLGDGDETKTYSFSNISYENYNYTFCFIPPDKTLNQNVSLQYSASGYPQRRWTYDTDLTNTSTEEVLYLLSSSDGTYSIYQVQTEVGEPIEEVSITAERQISGTWTLMEEGTTDSAGAVTFWLDPDYDHRITATKTGYTSVQVTVRPSSSTYTIIMSTTAEDEGLNATTRGMDWTIGPPLGLLSKQTNYTFSFNITSGYYDLVDCRMEIYDNNTVLLDNVTGCTARGGNLSVGFNTSEYDIIIGRYSVDIGDGWFILDADALWRLIESDIPERGTLKAFMTYFRDIPQFSGDSGRAEFTRILLFFLILVICLGALSYVTGWDFGTTGGCIMLLYPIIAAASWAGFFTLNYLPLTYDSGLADFMQQYWLAVIAAFLSLGYLTYKLGERT